MLVRRVPRLMIGPLGYLAYQPGVLDLVNRRLWLRLQISELRQRNYAPWYRGGAAAGGNAGVPSLAAIAGGMGEVHYGAPSQLPFSTWGDTTRICVLRDRAFRDAARLLLRTPARMLQQVRLGPRAHAVFFCPGLLSVWRAAKGGRAAGGKRNSWTCRSRLRASSGSGPARRASSLSSSRAT